MPGCGYLATHRVYCAAHYNRWLQYGDPEGGKQSLRRKRDTLQFYQEARRRYRRDQPSRAVLRRLAARAQGGDRRALRRLLGYSGGLIHHYARVADIDRRREMGWPAAWVGMDDLAQEGYIVLAEALRSWDSRGRAGWTNWLANALSWGVYRALDRHRPLNLPFAVTAQLRLLAGGYHHDREASIARSQHSRATFDAAERVYRGEAFAPLEVAAGVAEAEAEEELEGVLEDIDHASVYRAIEGLPPRTADVLHRRFWEGQRLEDVGDAYGITRERARQIQLDGLRRLREWYRERGVHPLKVGAPRRPVLPPRRPRSRRRPSEYRPPPRAGSALPRAGPWILEVRGISDTSGYCNLREEASDGG